MGNLEELMEYLVDKTNPESASDIVAKLLPVIDIWSIEKLVKTAEKMVKEGRVFKNYKEDNKK